MAVSPYTMNNLYAQGILDYTPYDIYGMPNVSSYANFGLNPYMQQAAQGALYQNYGMMPDTFQRNTGMNGFGIQGIGAQFNAGMNGFGMQGIGEYSQAGINGFGGGFGQLGNDVSQGIGHTVGFFEKIPAPIKGILALGIVGGTLALCFRKGKKPASTEGFWSKMKDKIMFWKK